MNEVGKGKRRGRPTLPPEQRKRAPVQFRTKPAFRAKLQHAADEAGRSLAQEAEFRLERSFDHAEIAGSSEWYGTAISLVKLAQAIERRTGKSPFKDWKSGQAIRKAWQKMAAFTFAPMPEGMMPAAPSIVTMDLPTLPPAPQSFPGSSLVTQEYEERREAEHDAEMVKFQNEYQEKYAEQIEAFQAYLESREEYEKKVQNMVDEHKEAELIGYAAFDEIFPEGE